MNTSLGQDLINLFKARKKRREDSVKELLGADGQSALFQKMEETVGILNSSAEVGEDDTAEVSLADNVIKLTSSVDPYESLEIVPSANILCVVKCSEIVPQANLILGHYIVLKDGENIVFSNLAISPAKILSVAEMAREVFHGMFGE